MDVKSGRGYPASALSNFAYHPFIIDGVLCNSMEEWGCYLRIMIFCLRFNCVL